MKLLFNKWNTGETRFVRLDSKRCEACWRCIEKCPEKVIARIDLPWHRHAVIKNAGDCKGCLRCVNACESGAFIKLTEKTTRHYAE